ncbi:MAG: transposase [Bdellovibrionaceae bacterium]|nr:transposase [Pseudobdellovibrionaceae bacterium]
MQGSKYTAEQIAEIVKEAYAYKGAIKEVARKYGIATKTIGNWSRRFRDMPVEDIKNYKRLEEENNRLKRLVARQAYDIECLKEVNAKKW